MFTQTSLDKDGRPVRDPDSTSYVAAIESAEDSGLRLYAEAWRRGWSRAKKKAVLGDGAVWTWHNADVHFPGATQIVDIYHSSEHLWELSAKLFPDDERGRDFRPATDELLKVVTNEAAYFERNAERMRYPAFRAQGFFVGSGGVEAGCKTVIGARLKRSGMFWTVRGANAIVALRCLQGSRRFEDDWEC